jgi:hypothetical protein
VATAIGIPGFANKWYYNTESGQLENTSQALAITAALGGGWHELNIPGSDTGVQAAAAARKEFPAGKTPSYSPVTPGKVAAGVAAESGISLTGLSAIGDFFSRLTQAHTWERIAEALLGVILIAVGLAHMTKAVPIATAIAAKVP